VRVRENQAVKLRAQGLTLDEIAEALDFGSAQGARAAIERALRRDVEGDVHHLRRIESERLQGYMRALLAELEREHVVVSQGRVVLDPRTHEPLRDTGAVVAIYRELRLLSREYSQLHGLHAPLRAIVQEITLDMVQGEMIRINAMAEELEREMGHEGVPVGTAPGDLDRD
jgi:DNA-binding transcriptional MerR regulator